MINTKRKNDIGSPKRKYGKDCFKPKIYVCRLCDKNFGTTLPLACIQGVNITFQ